MKKLIIIIAVLFSINSFSQNRIDWNKISVEAQRKTDSITASQQKKLLCGFDISKMQMVKEIKHDELIRWKFRYARYIKMQIRK